MFPYLPARFFDSVEDMRRAHAKGAVVVFGLLATASGILRTIPRFRGRLDLDLPLDFLVLMVLVAASIAIWRWGFTSGLREAADTARPRLSRGAYAKFALMMVGLFAVARGVFGSIPRFRDGLDLNLPVDYAVMVTFVVVTFGLWRWAFASDLREAADRPPTE